MFDMALEVLESVLSQKAARSCLEAGLNAQGKAVETASLEDYRAALRSNVFRQLQVVMPATAAAQLIREVEFQLEQLDNERTELDSRRDGSRPVVPQTMVDDTRSTAIRDPDLLAMAGSNLLTLNLRSLGSLSVEFGDVLFAERDLKLEVRAMRRTLDEGQHIERDKIEGLRDTLRLRRNILLVTQRDQLEMLDRRINELSQRVVVPRELGARLDSARRLLAAGTLATSDLRQMERLVENITGEPVLIVESEAPAAPEPVLEVEPAASEVMPGSVLVAMLDPESTEVFASRAETDSLSDEPVADSLSDEPVLVIEDRAELSLGHLEAEPEQVITFEPERASALGSDFEPVVVSDDAGAMQPQAAHPVLTDAFEPVAHFEPEPVEFTAPRSVFGSWDASVIGTPVVDSTQTTPEDTGVPNSEVSAAESFEPVVSAQEWNHAQRETAPQADPITASVLRSEAIRQPEPMLETTGAGSSAVVEPEADFGVNLDQGPEVHGLPEATSAVQDALGRPEMFTPESHLEVMTETRPEAEP